MRIKLLGVSVALITAGAAFGFSPLAHATSPPPNIGEELVDEQQNRNQLTIVRLNATNNEVHLEWGQMASQGRSVVYVVERRAAGEFKFRGLVGITDGVREYTDTPGDGVFEYRIRSTENGVDFQRSPSIVVGVGSAANSQKTNLVKLRSTGTTTITDNPDGTITTLTVDENGMPVRQVVESPTETVTTTLDQKSDTITVVTENDDGITIERYTNNPRPAPAPEPSTPAPPASSNDGSSGSGDGGSSSSGSSSGSSGGNTSSADEGTEDGSSGSSSSGGTTTGEDGLGDGGENVADEDAFGDD